MVKKRKTNTAMVFNPAGRELTINGATRRRSRVTHRRRSNPVAVKRAVRRNPAAARKSNPITSGLGIIVTAFITGVGVSLFDIATSRLIPQTSALVRTGVKFGGAYAVQQWGNNLPLLGKYKNEIALVLAVSGAIDLMKLYLLPVVSGALAPIGVSLIDAPAASVAASGDNTVSGLYSGGYPLYS